MNHREELDLWGPSPAPHPWFWEPPGHSGGVAGGRGNSPRQFFGPRRVLELQKLFLSPKGETKS